jgi:integrase
MSHRENKAGIKLRSKATKNGGRSLYLDIYQRGIRRYEFLHLYLLPETSREAKSENRNTMQLAEAILAKRIVETKNSQYGFHSYERTGADFYQYMEQAALRRQKHGCTTHRISQDLKNKLVAYCHRDPLPFAMIDKPFIIGFLDFMHTKKAVGKTGVSASSNGVLKGSTIRRYYNMLNATLRCAVRDEIIPFNPTDKIPLSYLPRSEQPEKGFLTEEELRKLYATHTKIKGSTREMFLFGCATGLRFSDIATLQWMHIKEEEDGTLMLKKEQMKTQNVVSFPLSRAAIALLPAKKGKPTDFVFGDGKLFPRPNNKSLERWAKAAGIDKHVSFHTSRHTFATLALTKGVDLYTVSKMLGHKDIKQTQIYAKILDTSKKKAVDLMPTFD